MHNKPAQPSPFYDRSLEGGLRDCPITQGAIESLAHSVQAAEGLILQVLLGAMATVVQEIADVESIFGGTVPTSLFLCAEGGSGVRKTAVAKRVFSAIHDFQNEELKNYLLKKELYETKREIFDEKRRDAKDKLRAACASDNDELMEAAEQKLISVNGQKPKAPTQPNFIFEDATTEAVQDQMYRGPGFATILSNEGGTVFNGHVVRNITFFNSQWSGEPYRVHRKTGDSFSIENARLTFSVLIQDKALKKFNKKHGEEAIAIGFWARFLFSCPGNNQGFRFIDHTSLKEQNGEGEKRFNVRINELLNELKGLKESRDENS